MGSCASSDQMKVIMMRKIFTSLALVAASIVINTTTNAQYFGADFQKQLETLIETTIFKKVGKKDLATKLPEIEKICSEVVSQEDSFYYSEVGEPALDEVDLEDNRDLYGSVLTLLALKYQVIPFVTDYLAKIIVSGADPVKQGRKLPAAIEQAANERFPSDAKFDVYRTLFKQEAWKTLDKIQATQKESIRKARASTRRDVLSEREGCVKLTPEAPASLENFGLLFMRLLWPLGKSGVRLE